jgi:hypothetical protein
MKWGDSEYRLPARDQHRIATSLQREKRDAAPTADAMP